MPKLIFIGNHIYLSSESKYYRESQALRVYMEMLNILSMINSKYLSKSI